MAGAGGGEVDLELVRAFVSDTGRVADAIEDRTPIEWEVLEHWPDYRGELPGARAGGRSMWPRPLRLPGDVEARVQAAFDQPSPTDADRLEAGVGGAGQRRGGAAGPCPGSGPGGRPAQRAPRRRRGGPDLGARPPRSRSSTTRWSGVVVDGELVPGRVVLATGGFQHDAGWSTRYLPGPAIAPLGPGGCSGDGLRMVMAVDSVVANTSEGWWMPAMHVPGETVDGVAHYRPLHGERAQPGAIMVDRTGRRFVDEAQNYGDVGRAMRGHRPGPFWLVFDAAYRRRYPVGPLEPGAPVGGSDPEWLARADDLDGLATMIGIESGHAVGHRDTVQRGRRGRLGPRLRTGLVSL